MLLVVWITSFVLPSTLKEGVSRGFGVRVCGFEGGCGVYGGKDK